MRETDLIMSLPLSREQIARKDVDGRLLVTGSETNDIARNNSLLSLLPWKGSSSSFVEFNSLSGDGERITSTIFDLSSFDIGQEFVVDDWRSVPMHQQWREGKGVRRD